MTTQSDPPTPLRERVATREAIFRIASRHAKKHHGALPTVLQAYKALGSRGSYSTIGKWLRAYAEKSTGSVDLVTVLKKLDYLAELIERSSSRTAVAFPSPREDGRAEAARELQRFLTEGFNELYRRTMGPVKEAAAGFASLKRQQADMLTVFRKERIIRMDAKAARAFAAELVTPVQAAVAKMETATASMTARAAEAAVARLAQDPAFTRALASAVAKQLKPPPKPKPGRTAGQRRKKGKGRAKQSKGTARGRRAPRKAWTR